MLTARLLTVSRSIRGGGDLPRGGHVCPGGCGYPSMQGARHSPVNRMTDRCKSITLPQTSFVGGNNYLPDHNVLLYVFVL